MHEYDTVLKALLQGSRNSVFERITGAKSGEWLNVELPEVRQLRVDLLFKTKGRRSKIIGVELQSANDRWLPLRMAEYSLGVYRVYNQFPEQYVLYVGNERMRLRAELAGPDHVCRYKVFDIRSVDAESLLDSEFEADSIIAILARYRQKRETIRRILERIAKLEGEKRGLALSKLMILAGLRKLGQSVREEVKQMPIMHDIMDHDLLGPILRQGIEQGLEQGIEQGLEQGLERGIEQGLEQGRRREILAVLSRLITKRFGPLSADALAHLEKLSTTELEDMADRLLDANSIADLFPG
jgi:predicted transposase YdaD